MLKNVFRGLIDLVKSHRLVLVGSGDWTIRWTDAPPSKGVWLLYESGSGRREFESSRVPEIYRRRGGESKLPGHGQVVLWSAGGPFPAFCTRIKKDA